MVLNCSPFIPLILVQLRVQCVTVQRNNKCCTLKTRPNFALTIIVFIGNIPWQLHLAAYHYLHENEVSIFINVCYWNSILIFAVMNLNMVANSDEFFSQCFFSAYVAKQNEYIIKKISWTSFITRVHIWVDFPSRDKNLHENVILAILDPQLWILYLL